MEFGMWNAAEVFLPNTDLALLVLRLALGIIFLAHGPMKLTKTKEMAQGMGLSELQVRSLGIGEVVGSALVLLGIWPRVGAGIFMVVMLGAIYFKSQKWDKNFSGQGGWEFEFMILAAAFAVFLAGAGAYRLF